MSKFNPGDRVIVHDDELGGSHTGTVVSGPDDILSSYYAIKLDPGAFFKYPADARFSDGWLVAGWDLEDLVE